VFVACSTQCFARLPLERALRIINELEFSKVDIAIHEQGPHLRPSEVQHDLTLALQRIRIGPSLSPAAFDVEIEAPTAHEYTSHLRAICKLARQAAVAVLTIPAASNRSSLDAEILRLRELAHLVETEGLTLTVATRVGTLTETPAFAVELCERVPGLGLTLDPSHFINGPHQGEPFDEVFPYVRHVHLRDTGRAPGKFQVRVGQGEVEYGRIISQLERCHYDRLLTVAIHDVADAPFAMESEVRKLKYLLESLV
jgi:sugar phosphate isomerase/epimerase